MNRRAALSTVFFVVFIDLIGFGIVLPHLAFYAGDFGATPFQIGFLYSIYSIAQLFFSPFWGSLSDRIGRRPVMLISTLGASASYVLFAFSHSLPLLFLSRLFAGIMAGNISAAQAYVADVTAPEERAKGMGLIGAAFGIGFVVGPALGAGLMHLPLDGGLFEGRPYAPLGMFAAGLSFASFLMVAFKLPESVTLAKAGDGARVQKISVFSGAFWKSLSPAGNNLVPAFLFLSAFLFAFGQANLYGAFPLFCKELLGLTPGQVGLLYVLMGLIAVLIQGGLTRVLVKKAGEAKLFWWGSVLFTAGIGSIAVAPTPAKLALALTVMAVGGSLAGPTLTSLVSKTAREGETGALMGINQGFSSLGRAIGPAWGGYLYGLHYQLPFIVTALIVSLTIAMGAFIVRRERVH